LFEFGLTYLLKESQKTWQRKCGYRPTGELPERIET